MIPDLDLTSFTGRLEAATESPRIPLHCQWEITCRCNFKCVMCYTDCFNTAEWIKQELSTEEIFRIMDEMKDAGVLELVLTGGEPLARPDFGLIYQHAVQNGFLTSVFTNGWFIDEKHLELWEKLPPTRIEISYHGASSETFDRITGIRGAQERVRHAIRLLWKRAIPLTVKATGMTLNQDEILEIKKMARSMAGVNFRLGQRVRPLANGDTSSMVYQLGDDILDQLEASDPEFREEALRQQSDPELKAGCHSGVNRFHIDAYGNLQLCSSNRRAGHSLRTGSFKEGFYQHLPHFPCPYKNQSQCCPSPSPLPSGERVRVRGCKGSHACV